MANNDKITDEIHARTQAALDMNSVILREAEDTIRDGLNSWSHLGDDGLGPLAQQLGEFYDLGHNTEKDIEEWPWLGQVGVWQKFNQLADVCEVGLYFTREEGLDIVYTSFVNPYDQVTTYELTGDQSDLDYMYGRRLLIVQGLRLATAHVFGDFLTQETSASISQDAYETASYEGLIDLSVFQLVSQLDFEQIIEDVQGPVSLP